MDGRPWTNECCMCVRSTHAEVGRSGRGGRRKADFGQVVSPPRGGFGGFEGVISGRWRAELSRGRSGLGAQTGLAGGTSVPNWGHNRRPVGGFGGFRGFRGFVSGQTRAAKLPPGRWPGWSVVGAYPCRTGGTSGRRVVGSVGFRELFWLAGARKTALGPPLAMGASDAWVGV
jgi:hypothetical protein